MSVVYDEYQKDKTRKRRPFYTPPPRLARATSWATGFSSSSPVGSEAAPSQDLQVGIHRRLLVALLILKQWLLCGFFSLVHSSS